MSEVDHARRQRRSLVLVSSGATLLLVLVLGVTVWAAQSDWVAGRKADRAAWKDVSAYALDLADRAGAELYQTVNPRNDECSLGGVEADLTGTSAAEVRSKVAQLRVLLREDGWSLGPASDDGIEEGTRTFRNRAAYVFIEPSGEPTIASYSIGVDSEHCLFIDWF